MNRTNKQRQKRPVASRSALALRCPACGAAARRAHAHFCATCGRSLKDIFYAPADVLFASYHQQRNRPAMLFEHELPPTTRGRGMLPTGIFEVEQNTATAIALIFVFSSLVPYVGILFCPFAILVGGFGLLEAWFFPQTGGARIAACCIMCALLIAGAQVSLWFYF
ncbi:MAG: hypothetical protein ACR2G4_03840 [Pyrinomonadaceae bacterium]